MKYNQISKSYNPNFAETKLVWANPRSLATTKGITFVFFSYWYWDVSVPNVRPVSIQCQVSNLAGCPIRKSADHVVCANPRSLSQLITSFIASESLGIHRLPLLTFLLNSKNSKQMNQSERILDPCLRKIIRLNRFASICSLNTHTHGSCLPQRYQEEAKVFSLLLFLLSICQWSQEVKAISLLRSNKKLSLLSGEYRIRTDDPLLAKQVL